MTDHCHGVEEWVERHRLEGHYPHAAPTEENPERWDCECGTVWRILSSRFKIIENHLGVAQISAVVNVVERSP